MKKIILALSLFIAVLVICSCTCCLYNRSSVTSYENHATTDGKIRLDTEDSHSVAGDKEKALSNAISGEGNAASSDANAARNEEDQQEEQNTEKENQDIQK